MKKYSILISIVLILILIKIFGLDQLLSFEYIKSNQASFAAFYNQNELLTIVIYLVIYVLTTALSIPGATVLTLLGGALFGFGQGLLIVSFASTLGATLAFLISRTLLKDWVEKKYGSALKTINEGIEKEGAFYLFTLRLVPVVPFFLINLVMGLTKIKTLTFFIVSQVGMLFGTAVYVNAGVRLSELEKLSGILSFELLASFSLLGIFPLVAKKIVDYIKAKKVYKKWNRPKSFDYNMVVIGAGAAGLVTSYISAATKAKVVLIEKEKMGGDCLNTGCVPSKALIRAAKAAYQVNKSNEFGINVSSYEVDFKKIMQRVHNVIKKIEPHDSIERYESLGVECITGEAKIISPFEVEVNGVILTTKNITVATGARPFIPKISGIENIDILHSNNLWQLNDLPKKLVILGAGPIGLEMAQSFNRLGSEVSVIEMGSQIMAKEDLDTSTVVLERLSSEGVKFYLEHKAIEFRDNKLICEHAGDNIEFDFDKIIIAVGRTPNVLGFGLEELGIELNPNNTIKTNEYLQTSYPNIYACGDVAGPYQLTHAAAHQAWYCAVNALFGKLKKFKVDYSTLPWCTYTDPEVASVGKNEKDCQKLGIEYEVTKYEIDDLDRAIADGTDYGFVKILTAKNSDKILGATIVGVNAGELLAEIIAQMKNKKGLNTILATPHSYPTMAEANKFAAGVWKQKHKPEKLLEFVNRFHQWSRR